MIWKSTILSSLLWGLLCLNFKFVKGGPLSGDAMNPPSGPDGNDIDSSDFTATAFSSILQSQLWSSDILTSLFRNPLDVETAANMASAIAESLVLEVGVIDSYSATDLIIDALLSVNPNTGPEAYYTELTNVVQEILLKNKILNSENYFTLANTISRIILDVASDLLNAMKNIAPININKVSNDVSADIDIGGNVLGLPSKYDDLDTRANLNPLLDVNVNAGLPLEVNLNTDVDMGINSDLSVSEEANIQFKLKLTNELLKDITFRNVFSDYIPPNALKQIAAVICQYISKAFHVSRLFLLPLENSIGNLSFDSSPTPELYGKIITNILADLLSKSKFITKDTASLQGIIAANAITSGIASLIRIAAIPGVRFNINENTFNSYFSILNGLEKLPYVGVDAASPKLPLAVKLTYASKYASQFANILFYKLVSSSKFLEIFSPGISTVTNKLTAKSLSNFVTEAFGSPNTKLFYDLYCGALSQPIVNVNRVNYAKALSFATARALFLNGYFLSGNIHIQAAIAKNAIIRALTTRAGQVISQRSSFPILGLSWLTQLEGVSPSQILLKYGIDFGLDEGIDKNINTKNNAALGAEMNRNSVLGTGINLNTGLVGDLDINAGLRERLSTNVGLGGYSGSKVDLGEIVGAKIGLGDGLNSNADSKGRKGANIGLAGGQITNFGLGNGLKSKVGLREELTRNIGLGGGLNTNVDLGGGFDANLGLGGQPGTSIGLRGDLFSNFGLSDVLSTNVGLSGGLGAKTGLGIGLDINDGLGARLSADTGLGDVSSANIGVRELAGVTTGLGATSDLNTNLGAVSRFNTGLGVADGLNSALQTDQAVNYGLNTGLGVESGLETSFDTTAGLRSSTNRKKRSLNYLSNSERVNLGTPTKAGIKFDSDVYLGEGIDAALASLVKSAPNAGLLTDVSKGTSIGTNLGESLGINTNLGTSTNLVAAAGKTSNVQLSIIKVLPMILANKLYQSTALYTTISIVGARKIANLISQAMAGEFGIPIATIFSRSYDQFVIDNIDNAFEINVVGLAKSTTEALAGTGLLAPKFSLLTANQLADAVVSKFSSLIATSLEVKECSTSPRWTYLLNQDLVQPPLISGYNIFK